MTAMDSVTKLRPWRGDAAGAASCCEALVVPCLWPLHDPGLVDKFGKIDLAPTCCLFALGSRRDYQLVVEETFDIQVIGSSD